MNNQKGKPLLRLPNISQDQDHTSQTKTNGNSLDLGISQEHEPCAQLSVNPMDQSPFKAISFHPEQTNNPHEHDLWLHLPVPAEGDQPVPPRLDSIVGRSVFGNFFNNSAFNSKNNSVRPTGKRFELAFPRSRSPSPDCRSPIRSASPIQLTIRKVSEPAKYKTTKNQRLLRLYDGLMKIFMQDDTTIARSALSPVEQMLLIRIVRRKFGKPDWDHVAKLMDEFKSEIDQVTPFRPSESKRKEEKVKFIYKMVLKKMRKRFEKENNLLPESNEPFYQKYFGDLSHLLSIPLSHFYDPSNNKRNGEGELTENRFKTINAEFLQFVFNSEAFKKDFLGYLQSPELLIDYQDKLKKKIRKLLTRWNKLVGKSKEAEIMDRANEYFINSERCKLPWAVFEVKMARDHFLQHAFRMGSAGEASGVKKGD